VDPARGHVGPIGRHWREAFAGASIPSPFIGV
jgi:hypothetical protein